MQAEYMSFRVEEADRISIDPRSKTASIDTNGPDIPKPRRVVKACLYISLRTSRLFKKMDE